MISVYTKNYSKSDLRFIADIFSEGLEHCWAYKDGRFGTAVCDDCEHQMPCKACVSALCYLNYEIFKPENPKGKFGNS